MKKTNLMKKFLAAALSLAMALSLAACTGAGTTSTPSTGSAQDPAGSGESSPADGGYKIAVVRQLDHASMNEIRDAIFAQLDAKAAELSITISYEDFNGNNDTSTLSQIGAQIIADGYDAIIPIGTLAAQQMASTAEATQTPVIYGTVSYPAEVGLTGGGPDRHPLRHRHQRRPERGAAAGHDAGPEPGHPDRGPAVLHLRDQQHPRH